MRGAADAAAPFFYCFFRQAVEEVHGVIKAAFFAALFSAFFSSVPYRFFIHARGVSGFMAGLLRLPQRLFIRAEVPSVSKIIPCMLFYTSGVRFAVLNAFAVSI